MVAKRNSSANIRNDYFAFTELDHLEAPDQSFVGHRDILTRSAARYHFVTPYLSGSTLDVGCGRGYGFDIFEDHTNYQVGVDISQNFLQSAQGRQPHRTLVLASGDRLPFGDKSFDSIISFEVIEHIEDDVLFLRDLRRLVREGGFIAISTPNKLVSSGDIDKPLNPFHVREYVADEFQALLSQEFSSVTVYGQHDGHSSNVSTNRLIDRIPMRWKYMLPTHIQGLLSVAIRTPLHLEDCRFETDSLNNAHSFVALCHP